MDNTTVAVVVPSVSLLVVVIGWFTNSWLTRKHEIAKRRYEIRVNVLKSFILISKNLNFRRSEFSADKMLDVQVDILTFGYEDEITLINSLVVNLNEKNLELASQGLTELTNLVRLRLRRELGLPALA